MANLNRIKVVLFEKGKQGNGLPADIEARRRQYEYYRNRLLIFEAVRRRCTFEERKERQER